MKVLSIQEKHTQADGKLYYKIELAGTRFPLIVWDTPQFQVNDDLKDEQLILVGEGERQTYSLRTDSRTIESSEKDASIREQTAIKAIIEIFNAGKLEEFQSSNDYLVASARKWIEAALVRGPLMSGLLEGKKHDLLK